MVVRNETKGIQKVRIYAKVPNENHSPAVTRTAIPLIVVITGQLTNTTVSVSRDEITRGKGEAELAKYKPNSDLSVAYPVKLLPNASGKLQSV